MNVMLPPEIVDILQYCPPDMIEMYREVLPEIDEWPKDAIEHIKYIGNELVEKILNNKRFEPLKIEQIDHIQNLQELLEIDIQVMKNVEECLDLNIFVSKSSATMYGMVASVASSISPNVSRISPRMPNLIEPSLRYKAEALSQMEDVKEASKGMFSILERVKHSSNLCSGNISNNLLNVIREEFRISAKQVDGDITMITNVANNLKKEARIIERNRLYVEAFQLRLLTHYMDTLVKIFRVQKESVELVTANLDKMCVVMGNFHNSNYKPSWSDGWVYLKIQTCNILSIPIKRQESKAK